MSYGTDALAADMDAIGQVASAALDAVYPGIDAQRQPGFWQVRLPNQNGTYAYGSGPTLREAIDLVQGGQS